MGEPYFKARPLIERHGIAVYSSNYTLYGDMSRRVMQTLESLAPAVRIYSIDEAFLDLGGIDEAALPPLAAEIRRTVEQWTGIPVSVGIGPTKTLAKAANRFGKRQPGSGGVCSLISPDARREALSQIAIGDVWGIGRRLAAKLAGLNIATALDLNKKSDDWLQRHFTVVGQRTAFELRGVSCIPLELAPPPRKALIVSRMFGHRLTEIEPVREALVSYVARIGEKLRRDRRQAGQMTVFLHNSPFDDKEAYYGNQASFQLPHATSDTAELIHHACLALARIFRPGIHYSKCGVMLTELTGDGEHQGDLFDVRDPARSRRLMKAVDAINRRMGRDTVFYAASGVRREWAMARNMKSGHFTTSWDDLPIVK